MTNSVARFSRLIEWQIWPLVVGLGPVVPFGGQLKSPADECLTVLNTQQLSHKSQMKFSLDCKLKTGRPDIVFGIREVLSSWCKSGRMVWSKEVWAAGAITPT